MNNGHPRDPDRRHASGGRGQENSGHDEQLALPDKLRQEPAEDVGALTHARYRFQWEVGARTCIAMLTGEVSPIAGNSPDLITEIPQV
jgi:hypothetical protein